MPKTSKACAVGLNHIARQTKHHCTSQRGYCISLKYLASFVAYADPAYLVCGADACSGSGRRST